MTSPRDMTGVYIPVVALLLILGAVLLLRGQGGTATTVNDRALENSDGSADFSHPDLFFAYHTEIRTAEDSPDYPVNYRMAEFESALAARKKPGKKLDWVERGPANVPGRTRALLVDPDDSNHQTWFAGSVSGGLWKTMDEGRSWQSLTDHLPNLAVSALAMADSDRDVIYMGTGEGFANIASVAGSGIFKSTDRGQSWAQLASTMEGTDFLFVNRLVVDPDDANTVLAATLRGIFRTIDGGSSWEQVYAPGNRLGVQDLRASPDDFDIQFATVNNRGVLRSTDGGQTWHRSLEEFVSSPRRMELAIAPSNPDVVYVSSEAGNGSELYRSSDGGQTWNPVFESSGSEAADWLDVQGWYDQAIAVHPYNEDHVYLGGVRLWQAAIVPGTQHITYLSAFEEENTRPFMEFTVFNGANYFGGRLLSGDVNDQVRGISSDDFVSVEVRFGPGRSQKAHRFSVSRSGGLAGDGGAGIALSDYRYEDYADVPFEVWDVDNDRQLMASFRDQANDGVFNLIHPGGESGRDEQSREYLFMHLIPYEAGASNLIASNGGASVNQLYFLWPFLADDGTWDAENLPESVLRISATSANALLRQTDLHPASQSIHVDHHNIHIIPIDRARSEFKILNANDGGVYFSEDGGGRFLPAGRGYNTTQFYGVDKRPGVNSYIAGSQDNGSWRSYVNPHARQGWLPATGGDGFETVWHSQNEEFLLTSSYYNNVYRSTTGGRNFTSGGGIGDVGAGNAPFVTVFGNSRDVPDRVFMIGSTGVWRSDNFGGSWSSVLIPAQDWRGGSTNGKVRVSLANPDVVWAGYRMDSTEPRTGRMHVSVDAGRTFEAVTVPDMAPQATISGLATHPLEERTAYVLFSVYSGPKILRTTDLGQTWTDLSGYDGSTTSTNGFPNVAIYDLLVMPHEPDVIWAGTEIGIFESFDGGTNWVFSDNGLPAVSVWQLRLIDGQIVVATHGRGLWTLEVQEILPDTEGYGPEIGDEFIFFVDGTNTRFEVYDGAIVPDGLNAGLGGKVLRLDHGSHAYRSFQFPRDIGVNVVPNVRQRDVLHVRLRVDKENSGKGNMALMFVDKTDGSTATDGTADLPFRAQWRIPEEIRDGQWHELDIPMPPATWRRLEVARASGTLGEIARHWYYSGAVTAEGVRVAGDDMGPQTSEHAELWQEFEWGNVQALGVIWDNDEGGGAVWLDDVFIGQPGLDLTVATEPVGAMSGVSFAALVDGNEISWTPDPAFGGYHVYASGEPITEVASEGVILLQYFSANATTHAVTHRLESPFASLAPVEAHYAVTSLSPFGVENPDVSASSGSVANPDLTETPFIMELTDREADQLTTSLFERTASRDGFPELLEPFRLDAGHSSAGQGGMFPESDADLSGVFWMGQSSRNELFVYAEIRDNVVALAGSDVAPADAWQYDSIELGWGNYDVREVAGGSVVAGSPHRRIERGKYADYQLRISAHEGDQVVHLYAGWSLNGPVPGGTGAFGLMEDADGKTIGWKVLVVLPLDAIQDVASGDAVLDPVTGTDVRLVPMNIALNDADESGGREKQIQWSVKYNADDEWASTPAQWQVVAIAGRGRWLATEKGGELPGTFALQQNYPNPFNPSTTIAFSLASPERVTLSVFDVLGRSVATVMDGLEMKQGSHMVQFDGSALASGLYFYKLEAGRSFVETRRMLLVK